MEPKKQSIKDHSEIGRFYDAVYYKNAQVDTAVSGHLWRLASKIGISEGQRVLDVGCGTGKWLLALSARGVVPTGIDLSHKAIEICKTAMQDGEFYVGPAETLPFADKQFDVISCLGSLEHFLDPEIALKEMVRVAKNDAVFLLLVPNADFLTRRLGLFNGTWQMDVREEVRSLPEWRNLFARAGLYTKRRWRDLHVLSWSWICARRWYHIPLRATQAFALVLWPLSWQYQVYHLCEKQKID